MAPSLTKNVIAAAMGFDGNGQPRPSSSITLEGSSFLANGHPILTEVPENITASPSPFTYAVDSEATPYRKSATKVGCFVGFHVDEPRSRHVVPIGKLSGIRFMSIFRFKVWWTTHWVGTCGKDMENETQMVILDRDQHLGRPYVLLLPILEGSFRASLQPGVDDDYVDICVESGSTHVRGSSFTSCLYIHVGDDPYSLVKEAMKVVRVHLGTFRLLEEKMVPSIVDKFGWCTWDAFYLAVHPKGVREGIKRLVEGGCPPGFVLIDDGWQSICQDDDEDQEGIDKAVVGEQMPCRLIKFEENDKFRNYESGRVPYKTGMGAFVEDLKDEFKSVGDVYVWHALCGYWGGIRPNMPGMPESRMVEPKLSRGLQTMMEDQAVDQIMENRVGLVPPELARKMYEGLHSHLRTAGIDGVKVDVIHVSSRNFIIIL